ncbi:hypothetical protein HYV89_01745 [Candidatus Woesearchaeota archaeon]|nr:hypothetical protein [Candidatus Woesearchaeota archaeon]
MRQVSSIEKLINSVINVAVVSIAFLPFFLIVNNSLIKKLIFISLFLLYKLIFVFFNKNRTFGMMITKTYWKKKYKIKQQVIHAVLYTASFSTLLFWIFFPFDLFLVNILLIQLPSMKLTGMTLHEYLCGGMQGIKR